MTRSSTVYESESPHRTVRVFAARNVGNNVIADQISSFRHLPGGWHYGEGRGATEQAIEAALQTYALLKHHDARAIEAFPDINGGILVSGYYENEILEVFCGDDGQLDMMHEDDRVVVHEQKNVPLRKIISYFGGLPWASTKLSDFSIPSISAGKNSDSLVWHFEIHPTMAGFPLSIQSVLDNTVDRNASTWPASIRQESPATLQSFGGSTHQNYPRALD